MPTWHQQRNPVKWYHETMWTVAEGTRAGEFLSFSLWNNESAAIAHAKGLRSHGYAGGVAVIPPASEPTAKWETY